MRYALIYVGWGSGLVSALIITAAVDLSPLLGTVVGAVMSLVGSAACAALSFNSDIDDEEGDRHGA